MPDLLERLTASLADRYVVEREAGRGGMAVVFLAEDLKHRRKVAIKVLHPELSAAVGADRFLREIEIVSALNHPHILPLFDSGEADGLLFYIMPYIDGEPLRDHLKRESRLSVAETVRIASEVADGLEYAHQHGVIHRDIKPGNILLSDHHAYITDFGIARALDAAGGEELTRTGIAVGTPAYMSPEQASGEGEVDARSDLYALGCVVHEMLAGEVPFTGPTPRAVIVRQMTEPPRPIRQTRHDVPPSVEKALMRALAKEPGTRFPSCEQFALALLPAGGLLRRGGSIVRRLRYAGRSRLQGRPVLASAAGATALAAAVVVAWLVFGFGRPAGAERAPTAEMELSPNVTHVAVLYFEDLSADQSLGPYAAGFTKGLVRRFNAVNGLAAPSYTAVRRFRGSNASPDSLAGALEVEFLAEGAVLPTPDGLQVEVDLVDPETGLQIGFVQQSATLAHLTDLLETVADSLTLALRPELGEQVRLRELPAQRERPAHGARDAGQKRGRGTPLEGRFPVGRGTDAGSILDRAAGAAWLGRT
jgi:serine/threonine-protein kinase